MTKEIQRYQMGRTASELLVTYRMVLAGLVIVLSIPFMYSASQIGLEDSFKPFLVTTSSAYTTYEKALDLFGDEEFILVAIRTSSHSGDHPPLGPLIKIADALTKYNEVAEVLSVHNFRVLQLREGRFGAYPVVRPQNGTPALPEQPDLDGIRLAFPIFATMVSQDAKTMGILIRIDDGLKFDSAAVRRVLSHIDSTVKQNIPDAWEYRIVGSALIRQAILKYSLRTAVVFGVIALLVCLAVTVYLFKSFMVTVVTVTILALCVLWVTGLMALLGIPIGPTTSMSFGVILLTTLEIVIHMVTRTRQFEQLEGDRSRAVRAAVGYLGRPLLVCSVTTAVGFGTCMVSGIPVVRQLGLIMALGVPISFLLAMILSPFFLMLMDSKGTQVAGPMSTPILSSLLGRVEDAIAKYYRPFTAVGIIIALVMLTGAISIRIDPQLSRQLSQSSPEMQNLRFVKSNLVSVESLELILEMNNGGFKHPEAWKQVQELIKRLGGLSEVQSVDSLLPSLLHVNRVLSEAKGSHADMYSAPGLIPELIFVSTLSADGKQWVRRYLSAAYDHMRIFVRIKNSPSAPIGQTIEEVRSTAVSVMKGATNVSVTGELAVIAAQSADLITSQFGSMFLAFFIIAILMMIQMNSFCLGLISLIPNILPVAAVFGIMGWFGIPLDSVTIFAASVAIGLSVDNTIQYMAQLKREIRLNPGLGLHECIFRAYRLAAIPMVSWSLVTVLGFLALLATPFQAAVHFGILVSAAVLAGMFGDLVFMQSMILTSSRLRTLIMGLCEKEMKARIEGAGALAEGQDAPA